MFCVSCGSQNPDNAIRCSSCGGLLTPAPPVESAPPSPAGAAKMIAGCRIASLGDRLIALILDTILMGALFAVVGMWAAVRWGGLTESGFQLAGKPALVAIGAVIVLGFIYYWLLEGLLGVTLGKGIVGIKVISESGAPCGLGPSVIRNILRIIDGLFVYLVGFLIAAFSKMRQRLGDHLARTFVVERATATLSRALLVVLWLVLIGLGIWGAYMIRRGASPGTTTTAVPSAPAAAGGVTASVPVVTTGDLRLAEFAFVASEDGPPRPQGPYKPGDKVFAKYSITGFTTDEQGRIHLVYNVAVSDPNGLLLFPPKTPEVQQEVGTTTKTSDSFWVGLPDYAPAGTYRARIKVHDAVKNTDLELTPTFTVEAPPLPESSSLEIRDIRLSLAEDGPPLSPAVVDAGQTLYTLGNLAGVQFREDQADVVVAFELIAPSGEKVIDRPDFLSLRDTFPYHPPTFFVPITGHVRLPSDAPKGTYVEKYMVTDRIANATTNYELKFEVQ